MTRDAPEPTARSGSTEQGYAIVSTGHMVAHSWVFRVAVVLTAYLCAALCCWLIKGSARPLLEALGPAIGVAAGFGVMRWMEVHREQHE